MLSNHKNLSEQIYYWASVPVVRKRMYEVLEKNFTEYSKSNFSRFLSVILPEFINGIRTDYKILENYEDFIKYFFDIDDEQNMLEITPKVIPSKQALDHHNNLLYCLNKQASKQKQKKEFAN